MLNQEEMYDYDFMSLYICYMAQETEDVRTLLKIKKQGSEIQGH